MQHTFVVFDEPQGHGTVKAGFAQPGNVEIQIGDVHSDIISKFRPPRQGRLVIKKRHLPRALQISDSATADASNGSMPRHNAKPRTAWDRNEKLARSSSSEIVSMVRTIQFAAATTTARFG